MLGDEVAGGLGLRRGSRPSAASGRGSRTSRSLNRTRRRRRGSGAISPRNRALGAEVLPEHLQRGAEPPVESGRSSSARRARAAPSAATPARSPAPAAHGQVAKKYEAVEAGETRRRKSVTIPKFRPPPPRQAQKRSALCRASQLSSRPSAVTIRSDSTLSEVVPSLREASPIPPPSARPPIPTVAHEPAGIVAPFAASAA